MAEKRRWKWTRRILFTGLVLTVLLVAGCFALDVVGSSALDAEIAKVQERGEPVDLADLAPPKLDREENGAIPLKKAFAVLEVDCSTEESCEARDRLLDDPEGVSEEELATLRTMLEADEPILQYVRTGLEYEKFNFDLDYSDPVNMEIPYVGPTMRIAKLLQMSSYILALDGDFEGAIAECARMARLADTLGNDPILISYLVSVSILADSTRCAQKLADMAPPGTDFSPVLQEWANLDIDGHLHRALLGERCFGLHCFSQLRDKPELIAAIGDGGDPYMWMTRIIPDGLLKLDTAQYMKLMARTLDLSEKPYRESVNGFQALEDDTMTTLPWYCIFSRMLLPILSRTSSHASQCHAMIGVTECGLAVLDRLAETGALPGSLDELDGDFTDPFTGAQLVYRVEEDGFIVHSFGIDLDDDGGRIAEVGKEDGDIAWHWKPQ